MQPQRTAREVIEREKRLIRNVAQLPDWTEIVFEDFGWSSRVYLIDNGRLVFKFPRSDHVKQLYEYEIAACKLAETIDCGVRVPRIRWQHPTNDYLGYEGIAGKPFDQLAAQPNAARKERIVEVLGLFLRQLHTHAPRPARTITTEAEITTLHEDYEAGLPVIRRGLRPAEQRGLERLVRDELPAELIRLGSDPVFCHGDLGYWNIIFGEDGEIGVIDFGDAGYYDRSRDFIGFADHEALETALGVYGDEALLRRKIIARKKAQYVRNVPFFIDKEDERGLQRTIADLRMVLAEGKGF